MIRHFLLPLLLALAVTVQADQTARKLFEQGNIAAALTRVNQQLEAQPKDLPALFLKGMLLQKLGQSKKAIELYLTLTRDHPQLPEPWNNLAVIYAAQGKYNKARDTLLNAINTHSSYATAYENLGNIYAQMAISAYNKALELGNEKPVTPIKLATISRLTSLPDQQLAKARILPVAPAATDNSDEIKLIIDTVNGWSNAWSAKNADGYLAYYAPAFRPQNGLSRGSWEKQRRLRLRKPRFIRVTILSPQVTILGENTARLNFEQKYESDSFDDAVHKIMLLEKINGQWQIIREYNA